MARLVISVAALCLAVCLLPGSLSQKIRKGGNAIEKDSDNVSDDVWLFHFGPANNRVEYLDPLTGEVSGYYVDLLESVCEIADKNCQIVYDLQSNCWDNVDGVPVGGFGLFNFYYDACVDPECVALQGDDVTGSDLSDDQIFHYASVADAKAALFDGEVDAMFDVGASFREDLEYLNGDSPIYCSIGGAAMMTRKDNGLKSWFDPALQELLASDKYQEICDRIEEEHGDKPGLNRDEICV